MTAYYNEIDPKAAAWLRELIKAGHIAPGEVDERSIVDIRPSELAGFVQCHFFAGIGVWSYALRRAGWPDNRPVWTGSCPCQPFSSAGKGGGFDDERHLWPAFFHLISECRPAIVFGEQVASKHADAWIDLVQADMEGVDYAFGAVPFPSAGVGAPHIRDRTYWMANAGRAGDERFRGPGKASSATASLEGEARQWERGWPSFGAGGTSGWVGHPDVAGRQGWRIHEDLPASSIESSSAIGWLEHAAGYGRDERRAEPGRRSFAAGCSLGGLANTDGGDASAERQQRGGEQRLQPQDCGVVLDRRPGPTNGLWRDADWLFCRDGKWRPVEPGSFPLAHGAPARVGRLRGYGNAINAEAAVAFIEAATAHEILDLEAA